MATKAVVRKVGSLRERQTIPKKSSPTSRTRRQEGTDKSLWGGSFKALVPCLRRPSLRLPPT